MDDLKNSAAVGTYIDHCKRGELGYQICREDARAVFYPRVVAPGSGSTDLEWRVSRGLGTVYATTTVFGRDAPPYNVALIDLDEGFRMMSRVEAVDPGAGPIGMRLRLAIEPGAEQQAPLP